MIEKLLLIIVIIGVVIADYYLFLWYQRWQAIQATKTAAIPQADGPTSARLLYFHSERCGACRSQAHYLAVLDDEYRTLIEPVDIEHKPILAQQFKVMTLPTTILIDQQGQVRFVNPGVINPFKLTRQLQKVLQA